MKNILVLIKNNLRVDILKNPFGFLIGLLAPVLILYLMLMIIGGNSGYIKIGVIDNDSSKTSNLIIDFLKDKEGYNVNSINKEDVKNLFSENAIDVAIEIKDGFESEIIDGNVSKIKITAVEDDGIGNLIKELVNMEMNNVREISLASDKNEEVYYKALDNYSSNISFNINKESLNDLHSDYSSSQIYIGFLIMFMLIRGMRAAYRIFDEKDENIYMRIFMAPVRTSEYYLADVISGYITILIQVVLGIVSINLLNVETGLRNIQLFIILALVGLVSISLALCCSAFSRNKTEASNIFNFANMVLLMVGGAFVPLEIMPTLIEKISYFTPVRWAMKSISDIQQGYSFSETYKYLFTILLFAIVFFVVGSYKTSREEKKITIN
ncbi:MAG: ABC transporter permease [Clostridium sp.]|jgi:drug ABC tranporter, ATP-binding/permease protein|uniref:ABC transporter permease n=1 Tax=Clostridium sp. TaxID=1506 RepID=UPI0025DFEE85|nr:ABC transporter permease [Clostridium sp.]MDY6228499.1 ABC transporter permease [Clostridium sp.]